MHYLLVLTAVSILTLSTNAVAESIAGRLGITGRIGATVPLKDDFIGGTSDTKTGFAAGGGLIYGFSEHVSADVEAFHMPQLDVHANGVKTYEASVTDIALGLQFRFLPQSRLVPYLGLGPDFITGNLHHVSGVGYKLDWTYGGHVNFGFDWFINPSIAMTTDVRGVYAADGDVRSGSTKVSDYRPQWFMGTVGFRLMLPKTF